MTYSAAVAYLYRLQKHGIKLGLDTMTALVHRLGMPQSRYRSLHIAGTNGKGSTAAMAASMLQAAGYRVGLYTSPHLVDFRERIRVNGELISEVDVSRLTDMLKGLSEPDLAPTFFECTTAMALQYFAEARVEVAVLEVGLGGRFDATNVVTPVVSAITSIALDHQEYLGSTLTSIAFEKAGIIKRLIPVVVGRVPAEALETIDRIAEKHAAPLRYLGRNFKVQGRSPERFDFSGHAVFYEALTCALQGGHQLDNAACALALLEVAGDHGIVVGESAVRDGLQYIHWEGRLEVVEQHPVLVLDGAHNPAAATAVAEYVRAFRLSNPGSRVILVLGMMRDKDHCGFFEPFTELVDHVVLTQADLPRSATVQELQRVLSPFWPQPLAGAVLSDALSQARQLARPEDLICVTGSLMLVGDVKALLRGCGLSPLRG